MITKLPYHEDSYLGVIYRDEDLLDYMMEVADHFCPCIDPDCFELVTCEDGKRRQGKRIGNFQPSMHPNMFGTRFCEGKITGYREKKYLEDHKLQDALENFGLDKEKFWYMCLYVKDYTLDKTVNSVETENTPKQDLDDILDEILYNLYFADPFQASEDVREILNNEVHSPYYVDDENGTLKQVVPDEYVKALKQYAEEKKNWEKNFIGIKDFTKEELTKDTISLILENMLYSDNSSDKEWYFEKAPKLSIKMGTQHSLEVTNPKTILALAYALNMMRDDFGKFFSLNTTPIDYNKKVSLGESYKLFQFNKMVSWFLKEKKSLGIPNVSTNKSLIISKMVYYTGLSDKEDYKESHFLKGKKYVVNTLLKDAIKKVNEKKLEKMHNNIYWT